MSDRWPNPEHHIGLTQVHESSTTASIAPVRDADDSDECDTHKSLFASLTDDVLCSLVDLCLALGCRLALGGIALSLLLRFGTLQTQREWIAPKSVSTSLTLPISFRIECRGKQEEQRAGMEEANHQARERC